MGDEYYFVWCEKMERCQWENERQMQTLLRQTERLRKENEELWAQMPIMGLSQNRHTQSWQTTSQQTIEASFIGGHKILLQ